MIGVLERVLDIQRGADRGRDLGAVLDVDAALGAVGHDLQRGGLAALQADAHEFEAHALDHRLDDLGQAPVDGGLGDEVGHCPILKMKNGPSGGPCKHPVGEVWTPAPL